MDWADAKRQIKQIKRTSGLKNIGDGTRFMLAST
jgi:hypothetical protein